MLENSPLNQESKGSMLDVGEPFPGIVPANARQEQSSPSTAASNFAIESFRIIIVAAII
ncbi:hypothetical protein VAWG006_39180 [Aeromonas enteropelogenes]|nr:hypothetical protein VAWG006_39180 [Aeromonas enteropelogenes]BEE23830.1 hypothetical protein VAWG007_39250 [Aeromonas enteropelogenes]